MKFVRIISKNVQISVHQLRVISDYFRTRAQKYEVLGTIPQSEKTFLISGYVPKKAANAVKKRWKRTMI